MFSRVAAFEANDTSNLLLGWGYLFRSQQKGLSSLCWATNIEMGRTKFKHPTLPSLIFLQNCDSSMLLLAGSKKAHHGCGVAPFHSPFQRIFLAAHEFHQKCTRRFSGVSRAGYNL